MFISKYYNKKKKNTRTRLLQFINQLRFEMEIFYQI